MTKSKSSTKKKKPKAKSKKLLKKKADQIFSVFIRQRDSRPDGSLPCYTCPHVGTIKTMQNGHFIPRQHLLTRYDEVNCHAQCYACNMLYNGQPGAYAVRLEKDYGEGTVARLEAARLEVNIDFNYQAIIDKYRPLLKPEGAWNAPSLVQ